MLSPSEVAMVCPGATLAITCSTNRRFLNWSVTIPPSLSESGQAITRSRLVASGSQTIRALVINMREFSISIICTMDSFISVLSVTDVTVDLNGTIVHCTDIGDPLAESSTSMIIVQIIRTDVGR